MPIKESQRCCVCEHSFIAHDYELTHKTVSCNDGALCKHFKEEKDE